MRPTPIAAILASFLAAATVQAQTAETPLGSRQRSGVLTASTIFQRYDGAVDLREFSLPLSIRLPVNRRLLITATTAFGAVSGDAVTSLSGLTDAHVEAMYSTELGTSSMVISIGTAIPIGKRDLAADEFDASVILSQQAYGFRVPGFGQDFRLTPSVAFAIPVSERLVAGFGGSYLLRSSYAATEELDESYSPGNELALTAGMDLKLGASTYASADLTYTTYGTDALGGSDLATIGDKVLAVIQLSLSAGPDAFRLLGLFRSQAETSAPEGTFISPDQRGAPSRGELRAAYSRKVRSDITVDVLGRLRSIGSAGDVRLLSGDTVRFPGQTMLDIGGGAVFSVDPNVDLPVHLTATIGDIDGVEVGAGLRVRL